MPKEQATALLKLYEPLFQQICLLNRAGRKAGSGDCSFDTTRQGIQTLFQQIRTNAKQESYLERQHEKLERPLVYFVDSMILDGNLELKERWMAKLLAVEWFNEAKGNVVFIQELKKNIAELDIEAAERLVIYYVCLGLGFTGNGLLQSKQLVELMTQLRRRVTGWGLLEVDLQSRIHNPAEHAPLDTNLGGDHNWRTLFGIGLLFVILIIGIWAAYSYLFSDGTEDLSKSIKQIEMETKQVPQ